MAHDGAHGEEDTRAVLPLAAGGSALGDLLGDVPVEESQRREGAAKHRFFGETPESEQRQASHGRSTGGGTTGFRAVFPLWGGRGGCWTKEWTGRWLKPARLSTAALASAESGRRRAPARKSMRAAARVSVKAQEARPMSGEVL